ncbi:hypothetical protein BYT27DRAFT_7180405 [Phlegmacium glaucopus]|nr:hypothetical protein BYT27DRAFT_7180405 [Phlegmacium glaucopus]
MNNALLDPVLKYIAAYLPPPLYSVVITLLSRSFTTATSIARLCNLLLPTDWNVQAFLPAIITILAAYLALASLYRTTSLVLRTSFWLIKWGSIISILLAGASYYMGNNVAVGNRGIIPDIGRYMINLANGDHGSAGAWQTAKLRQGRKQKPQRPKAWESFARHREWQYQEANDGQVQGEQLVTIIADAADRILEKSEWWAVVKNMWGNSEEHSEGRSPKNTKSNKAPTGNSRSR